MELHTETLATFPLRTFKRGLYHVGTMDRSLKHNGSHEGSGLSVSTVPDAWERINSFTSGTWWKLTRPGNQFLDFHRMTRKHRKAIAEWGICNGFVRAVTLYRHRWFDDELDEERFSDYLTREEAQTEAGFTEESEDSSPIRGVPGLVATEKLCRRIGEEKIALGLDFDLLTAVFAEDELKIDGVWWQDKLDVYAYSAPRGVIFDLRLPEWKREISKFQIGE